MKKYSAFERGVAFGAAKGHDRGRPWIEAAATMLLLGFFTVTPAPAQDREAEAPRLPAGLESPSGSGEESEPALPEGLGEQTPEGPALPQGLGDRQDQGPELPAGLGEAGEPADRLGDEPESMGFFEAVTGFWDLRLGVRVREDPNQRSTSLGETRLQLSRDTDFGDGLLRVTADFVYDDLASGHGVELEPGRGWLDLREAYFGTALGDAVDLRVGRQTLTWGVGDLLFLNDLFPKDWNSFLTGRDIEYLKAPSDALRAAFYLPAFNLDLVYTPRFDPDRFVDNRGLSFFDPRFGEVVGDNAVFLPIRPDDWFDDEELAVRLYRIVAGWELAAYGYRGFWKSPQGFDPVTGRPLFPRLSTWGGSARGPLGAGILSLETAWYRSRDDLSGTDPLIPNSQVRMLVGYEQEVLPDFTLGAQYYLERTLDHDELVANQPPGLRPPDQRRHLLTLRATLLTHSQNVTWSLFTFASPSDEDAYLRGSWAWKATDSWTVSAGFNRFEGKSKQTFFGQFETNSNVYAALRRGF